MYQQTKNSILTPTDKLVSFPKLSGKNSLREIKDKFAFFDKDIERFRFSQNPTDEVDFKIWELSKKNNFKGMFSSFGLNHGNLITTENQVVAFMDHYVNYLGKPGGMTFFLVESSDLKLKGSPDQFKILALGTLPERRQSPYLAQLYPFESSVVEWTLSYKVQVVVPLF